MIQPETRVSSNFDERPPIFNLDPDRIWLPLKRSALGVLSIIALCLVLSIAVFLLIEPQYRATASLRIDPEVQRVVGTEDTPQTQSYDADKVLETTLAMARSKALAQAVMRDLRLSANTDFIEAMGEKLEVEAGDTRARAIRNTSLEILLENMSAELIPNTRVAELAFKAPDASLSAKIANSYATNLIRFDLQQKSGQSEFAREFLDKELGRLRAELGDSEAKANNYARNAQIVSLPGQISAESDQITLTSATLARLNEQLAMATAQRIQEESAWRTIARQDALSVPQINGNLVVQRIVGEMAESQAALDSAKARHGPMHPEVRQLEAKASTLSSQLNSLTAKIKRGLKSAYDGSVQEERQLQARLNTLRGQQLAEQDRSVDLNILERESQTKRDQYEAILSRFNDITAQAGAQVSNLSLLDRAEKPQRPYWPSLIVILGAGLAAGLLFAAVFILLRELVFQQIRSSSDIREQTGLPVIGVAPLAEGAVRNALGDPRSQLHEAYSEALASLTLAYENGLSGSLTITSSSSGDGKSTSAFALARAAGAAGKKVLLIDGDMRRPSQHTLFGTDNSYGLSNLLTGDGTLLAAVTSTAEPNVDLLPSGPVPPQPADILAGSKLGVLMAEAQAEYDLVIVDTPPVVGFADPLILAAMTQSTLLVVRANSSRPAAVRVAQGKLQQAGIDLVGALLAFYQPTRSESRDYYAYRSTAAATS